MYYKSATVLCLGIATTSALYFNGQKLIPQFKEETIKMEKSPLYKVVEVYGKNFGCVALKDIQKGTVILKEKPQCVANWSGSQLQKFTSVITNYNKMSQSNQENYLKLHNRFNQDEVISKVLNDELKKWLLENTDLSEMRASNIVGIYVTNCYEMGVGIGRYSETHISFLILLFHYIRRDFRRNPNNFTEGGGIGKEILVSLYISAQYRKSVYRILYLKITGYMKFCLKEIRIIIEAVSCTNIYVGITRI